VDGGDIRLPTGLIKARRVIHSFLLFFFICNYVENARRGGDPAKGASATPRYADGPIAWPYARQAGSPFTAQGDFKPGRMTNTTMLELKEIDPTPRHEEPELRSSFHPKRPLQPPSPAVPESAALAQAMSGFWFAEDESPSHARSQRGEEGLRADEVVQQLPQKVRYA
jgi:hypothetical protein